MNKSILSIIICMALITTVSALPIEISPSTITINNTYPGETHFQNITITTDKLYAITLTIPSNISVSLVNNIPLAINGSFNLSIGFKLGTGIQTGNLTFPLTAQTEIVETTITVSSGGGGSGGGGGGGGFSTPAPLYNQTQADLIKELEKQNRIIQSRLEEERLIYDKVNLERNGEFVQRERRLKRIAFWSTMGAGIMAVGLVYVIWQMRKKKEEDSFKEVDFE